MNKYLVLENLPNRKSFYYYRRIRIFMNTIKDFYAHPYFYEYNYKSGTYT